MLDSFGEADWDGPVNLVVVVLADRDSLGRDDAGVAGNRDDGGVLSVGQLPLGRSAVSTVSVSSYSDQFTRG